MTALWDSIAQITLWQVAYAIGLLVMFGLRGPSFIAWVLLADFVALLAILGAMDFGWLIRESGNDQVLGAQMVVWCVTAAVLAVHPKGSMLLAVFSVSGVATMVFALRFGVQMSATSAIVNTLAMVQLAVAVIGTGGMDGGHRRDAAGDISLAPPGGYTGGSAGGMASGANLLSQDRGGR